jgi:hypothetical protein
MRSRKPTPGLDEDRFARMAARIEDLENRVRLLEAHLRDLKALSRAGGATLPGAKQRAPAARARPRARCPGCSLELPKGRRGETCVWCGFMFSAVGARARR